MVEPDPPPSAVRWHGEFTLPSRASGEWLVGPLHLVVTHLPGEWRFARWQDGDPLEPRVRVACPGSPPEPPPSAVVDRIAVRAAAPTLVLTPVLADRPVVARPDPPLHLPSGEDVTLYIGMPAWIALSVGEPHRKLLEIPVARLSDTWFGASTKEGQLCYASRTFARLDLAELPVRTFRVVTEVTVRNRGEGSLKVERLSLPVGLLSVFEGDDRRLFTQSLTVERGAGHDDLAEVRLADRPPAAAGAAQRLSGPREVAGGNALVRALHALLG